MNSIDNLVIRHIRSSPGLYASRGDVLYRLLCTSNRDFSWVDGVPVDASQPALSQFDSELALANVENMVSQHKPAREAAREQVLAQSRIFEEAEKRAQILALTDDPTYVHALPAPNSLILNLPEQVSAEWEVEVARFKEFLQETYGWTVEPEPTRLHFPPTA